MQKEKEKPKPHANGPSQFCVVRSEWQIKINVCPIGGGGGERKRKRVTELFYSFDFFRSVVCFVTFLTFPVPLEEWREEVQRRRYRRTPPTIILISGLIWFDLCLFRYSSRLLYLLTIRCLSLLPLLSRFYCHLILHSVFFLYQDFSQVLANNRHRYQNSWNWPHNAHCL